MKTNMILKTNTKEKHKYMLESTSLHRVVCEFQNHKFVSSQFFFQIGLFITREGEKSYNLVKPTHKITKLKM